MNRPTARVVLIAGALLLTLPSVARADFFIVPFAGMKFGGTTSIADFELAAGKKKLVLGIGARVVSDSILGFEVEFGNIAGYFGNEEVAVDTPLVKSGRYVHDLTGSVVLSLLPSFTVGGLRPYGVVTERRTVPPVDLANGAVRMFTDNVGVRLDEVHLRSLTKDVPTGGVGDSVSYSRYTIGLLLRP